MCQAPCNHLCFHCLINPLNHSEMAAVTRFIHVDVSNLPVLELACTVWLKDAQIEHLGLFASGSWAFIFPVGKSPLLVDGRVHCFPVTFL